MTLEREIDNILTVKMKAEVHKVFTERQRVPVTAPVNPAAIMELLRTIQILGLDPQVTAHYEGRYPDQVFRSVPTIEREMIIPTISAITQDQQSEWYSPEIISNLVNQTSNPRSSLVRAVATMLDHPGPESDEGFRMLNEDLRRFRPEASIFQTSDFEKWWFKYIMASTAHIYIKTRALFDHGEINPEAENLLQTVEAQTEMFIATLESLEPDDLPSYLRFADLYNQSGRNIMPGHHQSPPNKRQRDFLKPFLPQFEDTERELNVFRRGLLDEDIRTWARLKTGWKREQIRDALAALPALGSQLVASHTIAALHVNLERLPPEELADGIDLSPAGFISLLTKGDPETVIKVSRAQEGYPALVKEYEEAFELPHFSAPIKNRPLTAIALLNKACEVCQPDDFRQLLADVHNLAQPEQDLTTPWLLALLSLKRNHPQLSGFVNDLLAEWKNLPQEVREILLNETPGSLALTRQGKLRVLSESAILTPQPEEAYASPSVIEVANKAPEIEEVLILPFWGEIGLMAQKETKTFISGSQIPFSEDNLLGDFARLATVWKDTRRRERHLFYFGDLNPQYKSLEEARKLFGITAIYIRQDEFIFILDEKWLNAQIDSRRLPVGFGGKLDETGQLHIAGMDKAFLGEPNQLVLNNLALSLTTQTFYDWGADLKRDREAMKLVHGFIGDWNRSQRNSLPKIDLPFGNTNQNGLCLPVTVSDKEKPVLVCQTTHSK